MTVETREGVSFRLDGVPREFPELAVLNYEIN